jgi:hypothetical protein
MCSETKLKIFERRTELSDSSADPASGCGMLLGKGRPFPLDSSGVSFSSLAMSNDDMSGAVELKAYKCL